MTKNIHRDYNQNRYQNTKCNRYRLSQNVWLLCYSKNYKNTLNYLNPQKLDFICPNILNLSSSHQEDQELLKHELVFKVCCIFFMKILCINQIVIL